MKRIIHNIGNRLFLMVLTVLIAASSPVGAQETLTLERCRQLAMESNKELQIAREKVAEAEALRQMAASQFFPTLTAGGAYIWNERNTRLLSDEQQNRVNHIGTTLQDNLITDIASWASSELQFDPVFLRRIIGRIADTRFADDLNAIGQDITDALNIDMTHLFAGTVSVTQPLYMGGKLRALHTTARLAGELAQTQCDKQAEELAAHVDEAYWRVVALQNKRLLAQQYYDLLAKLGRDVDAMLEAEVATMADVTQVRVKQNEAQMNLTKADMGLTLSRMVLNQMCGLPLDTVYVLDEKTTLAVIPTAEEADLVDVYARRKELKMLQIAKGMADAGVKAAVGALLPNIGLTGGYAVSNPNLYNGYQKTFGGMFTAGVVVGVPLCHPASIMAVKAAKHKRNEAQLQIDMARDQIALQVHKLQFELRMANDKYQQAVSSLANAEENLKLADESFKSGLVGATDLMRAQTAWLAAKTDLADAEIEMRMSQLYLRQALGTGDQ